MGKSDMLFGACIGLIASSMPAHAYLDPGTGSLIVQSLIGGLLAAGTFAGIYIRRVLAVFLRFAGRAEPGSVEPESKGPRG